MSDYEGRLRKAEWHVVDHVPLAKARTLVEGYHYARGASNTATYLHGLLRRDDDSAALYGVAWWIPPTKSAALATYPEDWRGVLALSRLVLLPSAPKNAATFLLAAAMKQIDRKRWPCLVTYADEWQGHTGGIYRAANWTYVGRTTPEATFVLDGRMLARKAGPKTRTRAEMAALGAVLVGRFAKHKFVHSVKVGAGNTAKDDGSDLA